MPPQSNYKFKWWDDDGNPLVGGKVYTYACGTTTDKATYTTAMMQTENANPVVLDSNGEAVIYLAGPTKFVIKDSDGNTLDEQDYVGTNIQDVYDVSIYGTWGSQAAISAAIADMSGSDGVLYFGSGTWTISSDLSIPSYVTVRMEPGAKFYVATTKTLTILGPIDAGPYEIFTWTGTGAIDISGSPTAKVPLQWFGGATGAGVDNSEELVKACGSIGPNQTIWLSEGEWRIATATEIGTGITHNLKIHGDGWETCKLYINTPAAVGVTFGAAETSRYGIEFKNFAVVGPAAACTDAINIKQWHDVRIEDVNLFVGASLYALRMEGCIHVTTRNLRCQQSGIDWGAYTLQANGIYLGNLELVGTDYSANVADIHVLMGGANGMVNGLYCESQYFGVAEADDNLVTNFSYPLKVSGTIQNCTGYPLYVNRFFNVDITNLYVADGNTSYGVYLKNCFNVRMNNIGGAASTQLTVLDKVYNARILGGLFGRLQIKPNCHNVIVVGSEIYTAGGLIDEAFDTRLIGVKRRGAGMQAVIGAANKISDRRNLMRNSLFNRWQSATQPDGGWAALSASGVWTQCGTGLGDTENRAVPYCAMIETAGGVTSSAYTVDAESLEQLKGKYVNYTIWSKLAAGQTFTDFAHHYLYVDVPIWVTLTAYEVGQAVKGTSGFGTGANQSVNMMVCIVAGTSGAAEPTWSVVSTNFTQTITDGTVTWMYLPYAVAESAMRTGSSADIDEWVKSQVGLYVPSNAVSVKPTVRLARQSVGGPDEGTMYISEPTLMVGWEGPDSVVQGQDEHQSFVQVGGIKIWGITPPAGIWISVGDINALTGQRCTVAGAMGTATWANFP